MAAPKTVPQTIFPLPIDRKTVLEIQKHYQDMVGSHQTPQNSPVGSLAPVSTGSFANKHGHFKLISNNILLYFSPFKGLQGTSPMKDKMSTVFSIQKEINKGKIWR